MYDDKIFIGEDFAIEGQLIFEEQDTSTSLDEFDIHITLSTSPLGEKLSCSTLPDAPHSVMRKADNSFAVSFTGSQTARLAEGMITMTTLLTHKATGVRTIVEEQIVAVAEPAVII